MRLWLWRGEEREEITRPTETTLMVLLIVICLVLAVLLSPLWVPVHVVLRMQGKRGFAYTDGRGAHSLHFDSAAFRPR